MTSGSYFGCVLPVFNNLELPASCTAVICVNATEETRQVNNRLNILTDLSGPHEVFWTDKSKASIVVKFQERVKQIRKFFDKC